MERFKKYARKVEVAYSQKMVEKEDCFMCDGTGVLVQRKKKRRQT